MSLLNDNLVITLPSYTDTNMVVSVLGQSQLTATITTLLSYARESTGLAQLRLVPEMVVGGLLDVPAWEVREDPDNHDYVVSIPQLVGLTGPSFRHCRRAVRTFQKNHDTEMSFHALDIGSELIQEAMVGIFLRREAVKENLDHALLELNAMQQLLNDAAVHNLLCYGVSIRGALKAFIICDVIDRDWALGLFWKADTSLPGIYSFLMHRTAEALCRRGLTKFNIAQDLGLKRLSFAKQAFAPIGYLKKYIISAR